MPNDSSGSASEESADPRRLRRGPSGATGLGASKAPAGAVMGTIAEALGVPVALLSRDESGWRFEGEAFPVRRDAAEFSSRTAVPSAVGEVSDAAGHPWTGIVIGSAAQREWVLMVPGSAAEWSDVPGLEAVIADIRRNLDHIAGDDETEEPTHFARRLYVFSRRLARASDVSRTHRLILETMARQVRARVGCMALYSDDEKALRITTTRGYPVALVEHVRIRPGDGVIGRTFALGRAAIGQGSEEPGLRRLRYQGTRFLTVPLLAGRGPAAVVALTDRDRGEFDERDLDAVRLLAGPAGLALARERLTESLDELTRAATVDPVTGLFNRRYFETRLNAEVQRARRQSQDLALLMVDIDDFKRINDTFGHLEGDRALKEVADLLRGGVRIFDLCARYGGEEFAIVMPAATRQMAIQVAERIRRGISERSRLDPLPITVSIGVGLLRPHDAPDDLVASADRALIAAKRAGKNAVHSQDL